MAQAEKIDFKQNTENSTQEKVTVNRVIFSPPNPADPFRILRVQNEKGEEYSTKGNFGNVIEGMEIMLLDGHWTSYRDEMQFICAMSEQILPDTKKGMVAYLKSGCVAGCGKMLAERIVAKFGDKTFDILDNDPDRLTEVFGIGKVKKERIKESWKKQRAIQSVEKELFAMNENIRLAKPIRKEFGEDAVRVIKEEPYLLCNARGVSFHDADRIAFKQGYSADSPERLMCASLYVLDGKTDRNNSGGDTYMSYAKFEHGVCSITGANRLLVQDAVHRLETKKQVVVEGNAIYKMDLYAAEKIVAEKIHMLVHSRPAAFKTLSVKEIEKILEVTYDETQREAIEAAAQESILVITGGPGTGKSTILAAILTEFEYAGLRVKMIAPTGKAAKRMSETTGGEATTAHRMLMSIDFDGATNYYKDGFIAGALDTDVIIMDESSMADIRLMGWLMSYIKEGMRFIIIGDVDQLPSVGPGTVLKDIIRSGVVKTIRLTKTFRQGAKSLIIMNARMINSGNANLIFNKKGMDTYMLPIENDDTLIADKIVSIVAEQLPKIYGFSHDDIQVLSPIRKKDYITSTARLNEKLQDALNPKKEGKEVCGLRVGDRVMNVRNNYDKEIFNGDTGKVTEIDEEDGLVYIDFDGYKVEFDYDELEDIHLCYATTVHKSQGSEYPVVVMPVTRSHRGMLQRTLLYTAVTRAKKMLVLVGEKEAIRKAVENTYVKPRYSRLYDRLIAA